MVQNIVPNDSENLIDVQQTFLAVPKALGEHKQNLGVSLTVQA